MKILCSSADGCSVFSHLNELLVVAVRGIDLPYEGGFYYGAHASCLHTLSPLYCDRPTLGLQAVQELSALCQVRDPFSGGSQICWVQVSIYGGIPSKHDALISGPGNNSVHSECEFEQCTHLKENGCTQVTEVAVVKFPDAMMQSRRLMRGIGILWVPKNTILFSRYTPLPSEVAEVVGLLGLVEVCMFFPYSIEILRTYYGSSFWVDCAFLSYYHIRTLHVWAG
jgi:hypothetical protein